MTRYPHLAASLLAGLLFVGIGQAQESDSLEWDRASVVVPLLSLGSEADLRLRTEQLLGRSATEGYLLRSSSDLMRLREGGGFLRYALLTPEVRGVWNSQIPLSLNEGAMWAGRGLSTQLQAGVALGLGRLSLIAAPEIVYSQNREFATRPMGEGGNEFVPPWQRGVHSVDLPLRFGDDSYAQVLPGQSTLALDLSPVVLGASSANQWWGPAIRNAIVMSNNAPGIPHLFLRTGDPLDVRVGRVEAKWMLGRLSESDYLIAPGGSRTLSGLVVTFEPWWERYLTLGVARAVYSPLEGGSFALGRFFDVLPDRLVPGDPASSADRPLEQVLSLFGRWVLPEDGVEVYAEWGRHRLPVSFRDLLVEPNHTQGYTLGVQWARPLSEQDNVLRLHGELTQLEQSPTLRRRPIGSWYASPSIVHGYTHRGQVIGAAIGPGGSSQWLAGDYLTRSWSVGMFLGRTRWANDAFYDAPPDLPGSDGRVPRITNLAHDVSLYGGVRSSYRLAWAWLQAELMLSNRLNYLWQNYGVSWETSDDAVDIRNLTLRFSLTPALPPR